MSDAPTAVPAPAAPPSSRRLVMVLTLFGVCAGGVLAAAYHSTLPAIERTRAEREKEAAGEVLRSAERVEALYLVGGSLVPEPPPGAPASGLEKVFRGLDASGKVTGYAMTGSSPGYADAVVVMFGWDPATKRIVGMKVLENRETPGLGDKIAKDPSYAALFPGRGTPLVAVRPGKGTGDPHEVDTISGATISSRAVVRAINQGLSRWEPLITAAAAGEGGRR